MNEAPINEVLVVGHHDPDTDAVVSALAYASFYAWQTGEKAIPCHLDELNRETTWLLSHLDLAPPVAIKDVYLKVRDVMLTDAPKLYPDQTLREGGLIMQRHRLDALPVVDSAGRYMAMLARGRAGRPLSGRTAIAPASGSAAGAFASHPGG